MNKLKDSKYFYPVLIAISAFIILVPFLGKVDLFDWDEINFAEAAREMIVSGKYLQVQINFQTFHEKPPLFIWLQVISMKCFGINEFAARFPNVMIGVITLVSLFIIGKKLYNEKFGLYWVISLFVSFLPFFYFKTGLIDPSFNLFIFLSIYFYYLNLKDNRINKYLMIAGLFNALAIMTKGPVGYLLAITSISIYLLLNRKFTKGSILHLLLFSIIAFLPYFLWFIAVLQYEPKLLTQFIDYQIRLFSTSDAGHGGPIYYHLVVLLLGCFPSSVFFFIGFKEQFISAENQSNSSFKSLMLVLFWVVLVLFSIVNTKIVHYSSLAYLPISFIASLGLSKVFENVKPLSRSLVNYILIKGMILGVLISAFIYTISHLDILLNLLKLNMKLDSFTLQVMSKKVIWNGNEYLIGILFIILIIISFIVLIKQKNTFGLITICLAQITFMNLFLPIVTPKVEEYTQIDVINFCKSLQGKDVYIMTLGYKSYISYYYAQIQPNQSLFNKGIEKDMQEDWLLHGKIDKDAYFITKANQDEVFKARSDSNFKELYRTKAYIFFKRKAII